MNVLSSVIARRALFALSTSILALTAGCAASFGGALPGYDQQACAERALRRGPDRYTVADAVRAFKTDCHEGGAEACSALGVMNELGIGVPQNAAEGFPQGMAARDGLPARGCRRRVRSPAAASGRPATMLNPATA